MSRFEFVSRIRQNANVIAIATLLIAVVWVALLIVNNQYKARELISEIEQEQEVSRRLLDEQREINIELAKVTLPGYIASGAREMGLEAARNENTVLLQPKPVPRFVTRKEGDRS